jgi:uncharacterized protein
MKSAAPFRSLGVIVAFSLTIAACNAASKDKNSSQNTQEANAMSNPVFHFEIPVRDMDRAKAFYEGVFDYRLTRQVVDGYDMALFPRADGAAGASGALAKGDVYKPSKEGAIIYFDVSDIDTVACCRFDGHRDKVFYRTGGTACNEESTAASSSLRR